MLRLLRPTIGPAGVLLMATILVAGASGEAGAAAAKPSEYTIGAALPLSGSSAAVGVEFQSGIQTALDEINSAGGVDGVPLAARFLDNQSAAGPSVNDINLLNSLGIQAVIMTSSAGVLATAPLATSYKMLMLNPAGSSPALIGVSPYLFSNITSIRAEADVLLPYLRKQGLGRMVLYGQNDAFGSAAATYIKPLWEKLGGTFLSAELEDATAVDHAAEIAKIKASNPDIVYIAAATRQAGTFIQQSGQLGLHAQLAGFSGLQSGGVLDLAGQYGEGMLVSAPAVALDESNPLSTSYRTTFTSAFPGADPTNVYSILAHDAVLIYRDAIQQVDKDGKEYSGDNLRQAINTIKTFNVAGGTTVFNDDGSSSSAISLFKVKDGKFEEFETVQPDAK